MILGTLIMLSLSNTVLPTSK